MLVHRSLLTAACTLVLTLAFAQQKEPRYAPLCVGFYNVENLYDTLDNPATDDAEWLPTAPKQWNTARYYRKLGKMAQVISELGKDVSPDGVVCMGFAELENRDVLNDLVHTAPLDKRGYQLVHHDSPDRRGVDVGFIYNPKYFKLINERAYRLT
ncbi:MAG TPA: endonuclease/exonuclease/phosphatase family protein, partial [Flavobacteriales bacterium]|nr:endonuclease/exonuclease/phosphatase family protein [Flavobacteriales bacterium]